MNRTKNLLNLPLKQVKGIGEKRSIVLSKFGLHTVMDLIYFFPRKYIERASLIDIADVKAGRDVAFLARVKKVRIVRHRKKFLECYAFDQTGEIRIVFFNPRFWMLKKLKKQGHFIFWGKAKEFNMEPVLVNPNLEPFKPYADAKGIYPVYPHAQKLARFGLSSKTINRLVERALELVLPSITELLPIQVRKELRLPDVYEAIKMIHFPLSKSDITRSRTRFAFEELFLTQLLFVKRKNENEKKIAYFVCRNDNLCKSYLAALDFELTVSQKEVFEKIRDELYNGKRIRRLIQGDVGCGKTVVAILASLLVVEAGYQVAFMAPTELLAMQHYEKQREILDSLGVSSALITGGIKSAEIKKLIGEIESKRINIVFGTHSLLSGEVSFGSLGLCVIDEQQRFGVMQRLALLNKAMDAHAIFLSATPIPRTLFLALYGDLDLSTIPELPPRKARVRTFLRTPSRRDAIYKFARERFDQGEKGYIVFPAIGSDDNGDKDRISIKEGIKFVRKYFPEDMVGIIHGRLSGKEKRRIFDDFMRGNIKLLVGTSIVEVGLDVKDATVLIIEGPEHFGLSQLHQIRGRIGRGEHEGYCILIASKPDDALAFYRLERFASTTNGFELAELDLQLRGWGNPWGVEQHGFLSFRVADPLKDKELLEKASLYAENIANGNILLNESEMNMIKDYLDTISENVKLDDVLV